MTQEDFRISVTVRLLRCILAKCPPYSRGIQVWAFLKVFVARRWGNSELRHPDGKMAQQVEGVGSVATAAEYRSGAGKGETGEMGLWRSRERKDLV